MPSAATARAYKALPRNYRTTIEAHAQSVLRLVENRGVGNMHELYEKSRKKLRAELNDLTHRNKDAAFSAHYRRVLLRQVEDAIQVVGDQMGGVLARYGKEAVSEAMSHLDEQIKDQAKQHKGVDIVTLDDTTAERFFRAHERIDQTLLRRYKASEAFYTKPVVKAIEQRMALGLVTGETVGDMINGLVGLGGKFTDNEYRAERIVRTELMNAYNQGYMESAREAAEIVPLKKIWLVVGMDDRVCQDCMELHGKVVDLNEEFEPDVMQPPKHPLCRCVSTAVLA